MRRIFFILALLIGFSTFTNAQSPKREMRAGWIATVFGLDWPNAALNATTAASQQSAMTSILDNMASNNMNAIYFQVRGRCDAMYQSAYEPWSADLTGARTKTAPSYDPLQYVITEAHKRGIAVHAWINPYRFESAANQWKGQPGDYRNDAAFANCIITYSSGISILDPGRPVVRQRIYDIVADILGKYDVDGIVFDDYFYQSGTGNLDQSTQNLYKPSSMDVEEWRRQNVNEMIAGVYNTIKSKKPYVTFGIAPFGIWTITGSAATAKGLTLPKGITGADYYATMGCDAVAWLNQGVIDYISPQLYWPSSQWPSTPTPPATSAYNAGQAYESLCQWWSDVADRYKRHFYASQIGNSAPRYMNEIEIGRQIGMNRKENLNGAPGCVLYGMKSMINKSGFLPHLKTYFTQKAIQPAIDWKTNPTYGAVGTPSRNWLTLTWNAVAGVQGGARYTVYAVPNDLPGAPSSYCTTSNYLLGISYTNSFTIALSPASFVEIPGNHNFVIGVLDRYGNEFIDGVKMSGGNPSVPLKISSPANGATFEVDDVVNVIWDIRLAATGFTVERSTNPNFTDAVATNAGPHTTQFQKTQQISFSGLTGGTYYIRLRTNYGSYSSEWSETVQFTVKPAIVIPSTPVITAPENGAIIDSNSLAVVWEPEPDASRGFTVQWASDSNFADATTINVGAGVYQTTLSELSNDETYYVRVRANYGTSDNTPWSEPVQFTVSIPPDVPEIDSSPDLSGEFGTATIAWSPDTRASGFTLQGSTDSDFEIDVIETDVGAGVYQATLTELTAGATYYARVRANYRSSSSTDWSNTVQFTMPPPPVVPYLKLSLSATHGQINTPVFTVEKGQTVYLWIEDAYGESVKRQDCTLTSSNTSIATISTYGTITTKSYGSVNFKAVRKSDNAEGEMEMEVLMPTDIVIPEGNVINISETETGVLIRFAGKAAIELYTIDGILIEKAQAVQSYTCDLNKGVYIFRINGQTRKFIK